MNFANNLPLLNTLTRPVRFAFFLMCIPNQVRFMKAFSEFYLIWQKAIKIGHQTQFYWSARIFP